MKAIAVRALVDGFLAGHPRMRAKVENTYRGGSSFNPICLEVWYPHQEKHDQDRAMWVSGSGWRGARIRRLTEDELNSIYDLVGRIVTVFPELSISLIRKNQGLYEYALTRKEKKEKQSPK